MEAVLRLEIVTSTMEIRHVCARLRDAGVASFTVMRCARGRGERGTQDGDDPAGVTENSYLVTTCTQAQLPAIIEAIRPILREFGGECLVSDATRIRH